MQFAICRQAVRDHGAAADVLDNNRVGWLKFGDVFFCYGAAIATAEDKLAVAGLGLERLAGSSAEQTFNESMLHLVIQEGRLFARAYPNAPVLYDRGRHMVVALDPHQASAITQHEARFSLRPITKNQVIFDVVARPPTAPTIDARTKRIVDALSRTGYESTLAELASYPTRHSLSSHFQDAAKRARDRLQMMGYVVRLQEVDLPDGKTVNIIADKQGTAAGTRSVTLLTAHLDSVNHPTGASQPDDPTALAPGADDNASGCSGVLEIARVFRHENTAQDLRLILFGGEEQGLRGSSRYVQQLPPVERARIAAAVNMDMIAVANTDAPTVLLEGGDPISQEVISGLASAAHAYTGLTVHKSFHFEDSDHVPFIRANIPAVLTIEGNDRGNSNIHSASDTLDHIDYELALEILRMNTAYLAERLGLGGSSQT
jgi:hypothetical protein